MDINDIQIPVELIRWLNLARGLAAIWLKPVAAGLGALWLLRSLVRTLRFWLLPEHEKLILRHRVPPDQAKRFRDQVFAEHANNRLALERWGEIRKRSDSISRDIVDLARDIDRRRSEVKTKDPALAAAFDQLFDVLAKDLATAMWIPEQWDEKLQAMAHFEQVLTANGASKGSRSRKAGVT